MDLRDGKCYRFGPFTLDPANRVLMRDRKLLRITPKTFDILLALLESGGAAVDKEELMNRIWPDAFVEEANLAVNISTLRKQLGEMPDGRQYIQTLPKRGYRLAAPIETFERDSDHPNQNRPRPISETRSGRKLYLLLGISIIAIALVAVAYAVLVRKKQAFAPRQSTLRLAVLPFTNSRPDDDDMNYLGFSLADDIITRLGEVNELIVRPSSYVEKYRSGEVESKQIALDLKVDSLLTGRYLKDGEDLIITVQLEDIAAGTKLWGETINIKYKNLFTVQDYVTRQVIHELHLQLTPAENDRLARDEPRNAEAYECYLRAIRLLSTTHHQTAIDLLTKSVQLDPSYSPAWAFLGRARSINATQYFGGRKDYIEAQAAYERALTLNPEQFQARLLMANFLIETNRVEDAVPHLRMVIDNNPSVAFSYWELSYAYRYAGMLEESVEAGERALQLDPNLTAHVFNTYFYLGEYDKFIERLPPRDDAYVIFYRGLGNYYKGDLKLAAADLDRCYELNPSAVYAQIGKAFSETIGGRNYDALKLLKTAESKQDAGGVADGEITYKIAQAYAAAADKQSSIRTLSRAVEQGFFCYPYLASDPLMRTVKDEPEYATALELARARHEAFKRRFF